MTNTGRIVRIEDHGTVVMVFIEGRRAPVIGDHRPMHQFLTDARAAGWPDVEVSEDGRTLRLID